MNLQPEYLEKFVSDACDRTPPMRVFVYTASRSREDYSYSVPGGFDLGRFLATQFSDRTISMRQFGVVDESGYGAGIVCTMTDDDGTVLEEHRGIFS